MKLNEKNKERGFSILAVILVIVAVIVAVGVWALSGQTNTSSSGSSTNDIQAASLINDSAAIKLAFDTLIIHGSRAESIVFVPNADSTTAAPNMLDPTNGVQVPKPNANAIHADAIATEGIWLYNPANFKAYAGNLTLTEPTILVAGVKDGVCQRVNNTLYGSPTIEQGSFSGSGPTEGATAAAPTTIGAVNLSGITALSGWTVGCVANTTADNNVFFRVLKVN